MELKHLIIAAIVANAAKSGRPAKPGPGPVAELRNSPGREAVLRGFRQFTELTGIATIAV